MLKAHHAWEFALWAVLDEGEIEDGDAIIAITNDGRFFYVTDEDEGACACGLPVS